jgi:hypothetical protein
VQLEQRNAEHFGHRTREEYETAGGGETRPGETTIPKTRLLISTCPFEIGRIVEVVRK